MTMTLNTVTHYELFADHYWDNCIFNLEHKKLRKWMKVCINGIVHLAFCDISITVCYFLVYSKSYMLYFDPTGKENI